MCTRAGEACWVKEGGIVRHVAFTSPPKEASVFQATRKGASVKEIDLHSERIILSYTDGTSELASLKAKSSEAARELPSANSFFVEAGIVSWEAGASSFFLCEAETGEVIDEFPLASSAKAISRLGGDSVLIVDSMGKLLNYNLRSHASTASIDVAAHGRVKRVALSADEAFLAVSFKKSILIFDSSLASSLHTVSESCPVKSMIWNGENVLVYSTVQHLKFLLLNGEGGILCNTPAQPEYVVGVTKGRVFTLTREKTLVSHSFEQSEVDLKLALEAKDFERVFAIINNCNLIGQSIIAYLRRKGYPQIALAFVKDPASRFELALECANLEIAFQVAERLNQPFSWEALAEEAMKQGNFSIAEIAYQKGCQLEKLLFLYCLTGQPDKIHKLQELSLTLGDESVHFLCGAFTASLSQCSSMLPAPLAHLAAKGFDEVDGWPKAESTKIPPLEWKICASDWPLEKADDFSPFQTDQPLEGPEEELEEEADYHAQSPKNDHFHSNDTFPPSKEHSPKQPLSIDYSHDDDGAGWEDLIVDRPSSPSSLDQLISSRADSSQLKEYLEEHLNITNSAPLAPYLSLPLPSLAQVKESQAEALALTTNGKFREAKAAFIKTLYQALLLPKEEQSKANEIISQSSSYILGLSMETSRKDPSNSGEVNLKLAVLFSRCSLVHEHVILALRSATSLAFKSSHWSLCVALCERLLDMAPEESVAAQTRKILGSCKAKQSSDDDDDPVVEGLGEGESEIERACSLEICSAEFRALEALESLAKCAVCGAVAAEQWAGQPCRVCDLAAYE
jgi:coatomer protein complex subunit alpha (xenin)